MPIIIQIININFKTSMPSVSCNSLCYDYPTTCRDPAYCPWRNNVLPSRYYVPESVYDPLYPRSYYYSRYYPSYYYDAYYPSRYYPYYYPLDTPAPLPRRSLSPTVRRSLRATLI